MLPYQDERSAALGADIANVVHSNDACISTEAQQKNEELSVIQENMSFLCAPEMNPHTGHHGKVDTSSVIIRYDNLADVV